MLDLNNNGVVSQTEVLRPLHLVQHCHQFGAKSIIERYVQRAVPKLKLSADHRLSKSLLYQQAVGCELKDFALIWPVGNIPRLPLNGNHFPVHIQDVIVSFRQACVGRFRGRGLGREAGRRAISPGNRSCQKPVERWKERSSGQCWRRKRDYSEPACR